MISSTPEEEAEKEAARKRIEAFLDAGPRFDLSKNGKIWINRDDIYDGGRFDRFGPNEPEG